MKADVKGMSSRQLMWMEEAVLEVVVKMVKLQVEAGKEASSRFDQR